MNELAFEEEAVFVSKDEDVTEQFEMVSGCDRAAVDAENSGRCVAAIMILDPSLLLVPDAGNEKDNATGPVPAFDNSRSCPSLSSFTLPNVASHRDVWAASGRRLSFLGTLVLLAVGLVFLQWFGDGGSPPLSETISLDTEISFVTYKNSVAVVLANRRDHAWMLPKRRHVAVPASNITIPGRAGSTKRWYQLPHVYSGPWRMLRELRSRNQTSFSGERDEHRVKSMKRPPAKYTMGQVGSRDSAHSDDLHLLALWRVARLPGPLSRTNNSIPENRVQAAPRAPSDSSTIIEPVHRPAKSQAPIEAEEDKITLRFHIDPHVGSYVYPNDPDIEFLTNETFYQVISGAASPPEMTGGAVFVNFFLHLCPSCPDEHPIWSPSWRAYAAEVRSLQLPVKVVAIDCLRFAEVCREQRVTTFPRHRWYQRAGSAGVDFTYRRTVDDFMKFTRERLTTI